MTIKWVHTDPLVMNGEPFLYGTRLTVRRLLELRAEGFDGARPLDHTAGFPSAVAPLTAQWEQLAGRAIVAAVERNPELRDRVGDIGLRHLMRDGQVVLEKLAESVASGSITPLKSFTEHGTPTWRRRRISMDDVTDLYEGLRIAVATVLSGEAAAFADRALLEGIAVLKWHRRLGGDTRKRNRILAAIYKGA